MDLISELPESILHHILHLLPPKDAARTCVLSKAWSLTHSRSPFIRFRASHFSSLSSLLFYAEKHLERFFKNNDDVSAISSFTLSFGHWHTHNYNHDHVGSLLKRVLSNGRAQILDLETWNYILPHFVLQSNTLTALSLSRCTCDARADIRLPKLTALELFCADIDDHFFERLTSGCPSLVHLKIGCCKRLTTVRVTCLEKLQTVTIEHCNNLSTVEISSLNLHFIRYASQKIRDDTFSLMKELSLEDATIKTCWLQRQLSSCEVLRLRNIDFVDDDIHISSTKLRKLKMKGVYTRRVPRIDCPNLQSFVYVNNELPFRSECEFKSLRDVRIQFCFRPHRPTSLLYDLLVKQLQKFSAIKDSIKQVAAYKDWKDMIILDGFPEFIIPKNFDTSEVSIREIVILSSVSNSLQLNRLVRYLSKRVRLSTRVYVTSTDCSNNNFSHVLFYKLSRLREEANCCKNYIVKCWRHKLYVSEDSTSNTIPAALRYQQFDQCQITTIILQLARMEIMETIAPRFKPWLRHAYLLSLRLIG